MTISDRMAHRIGQVTLAGFALGPALMVLALLFSTEFPHLLEGLALPIVAFSISGLSYAVAAVAGSVHMDRTAYLNDGDRQGWEKRASTKAALLVPFIYLLSSPGDRQVGPSHGLPPY